MAAAALLFSQAAVDLGCGPTVIVVDPGRDNPCVCDRASEDCPGGNKPDGTMCDDGDDCTKGKFCQAGACIPGVPSCDMKLYSNPAYQSPVRGDGGEVGDVVLLAGTGFTDGVTQVIYRINDGATPPTFSSTLANDATSGIITPFQYGDNGVTIRLPKEMKAGQSYALWAVDVDQAEHSNRVLINDARPMWVSPAWVYSSAERPGLERSDHKRSLKVVGRNLQPLGGQSTQVRLRIEGGTPLPAMVADALPTQELDQYVAQVTLPSDLGVTGQEALFAVEVSRDGGVSWIRAPRDLAVLPNPIEAATFRPQNYHDDIAACDPCVSSDHTLCIARALHDADRYANLKTTACQTNQDCSAGQVCTGEKFCGTPCQSLAECPTGQTCLATQLCGRPAKVELDQGVCGKGVWNLDHCATFSATPTPTLESLMDDYFQDPAHGGEPAPYAACDGIYGLSVPSGVSVVGVGAPHTVIKSETGFSQPVFDYWDSQKNVTGDNRQYVFTLHGSNQVRGVEFLDAYHSDTSEPGAIALLLAGHSVAITDDSFNGMYAGVFMRAETSPTLPNGLLGAADLVITNNVFGCWSRGVSFDGVEDGAILGNVFSPGGSPEPIAVAPRGASRRLDVSSNVVNGTDPTYAAPYVGWRSAIFFSLHGPNYGSIQKAQAGSNEEALVADNQISCVGTRPDADGEGIGFDANGEVAGFSAEQVVTSAETNVSCTVAGRPELCSQVTVSPGSGEALLADYVGSYLWVTFGPGLGQARKIVDPAPDPAAASMVFTVWPRFDALPSPEKSLIHVGSLHRQIHVIGNTIDNSCTEKVNPSVKGFEDNRWSSAGEVLFYGPTADSVIEANSQTATAGIRMDVQNALVPGHPRHWLKYFIEVRGNAITGSIGSTGAPLADNSWGSGIYLNSLVEDAPMSNLGFGVSISRNVLVDTALVATSESHSYKGAIVVSDGSPPELMSKVPGYVDTIVFANHITGTGADPHDPAFSYCMVNGGDDNNYPEGTVLCDNDWVDCEEFLDGKGQPKTSCP